MQGEVPRGAALAHTLQKWKPIASTLLVGQTQEQILSLSCGPGVGTQKASWALHQLARRKCPIKFVGCRSK